VRWVVVIDWLKVGVGVGWIAVFGGDVWIMNG